MAHPIRPAAGVILVREDPRGLEVYLLHRAGGTAFLPGFHCFPGGSVDPEDADLPVAAPPGPPGLAACAARELFEETGILLVDGPPPPRRELEEVRARLLAGGGGLGAMLARHGLRLDGERLRPAGVRLTPPYSPIRFRARFFLTVVGPEAQADPAPREFCGGGWWTVAEALEAWSRGELLLVPPTLDALLRLDRYGLRKGVASLEASPEGDGLEGPALPLSPGLSYVPLRTRTLPPATHTLCFLVGGSQTLIVDPGSAEPDQLGPVFDAVQALAAQGRPPREILLTHHHPDHVEGALELARTLGIPLAGHPETGARLPFPLDREVGDGEEWDLGSDPSGGSWRVRALHTPGHAPGHLCLWEPERRFLVAGDMVAGVGTIVIDPPEGDMELYLASLRRLRDLDPRLVMPAHGAPFGPGSRILERYLQHRQDREDLVLEALAGGAAREEELVGQVYAEIPAGLRPLAARSLLAHLLMLEAEGRVRRAGGGWAAVPGAGEGGSAGPGAWTAPGSGAGPR